MSMVNAAIWLSKLSYPINLLELYPTMVHYSNNTVKAVMTCLQRTRGKRWDETEGLCYVLANLKQSIFLSWQANDCFVHVLAVASANLLLWMGTRLQRNARTRLHELKLEELQRRECTKVINLSSGQECSVWGLQHPPMKGGAVMLMKGKVVSKALRQMCAPSPKRIIQKGKPSTTQSATWRSITA